MGGHDGRRTARLVALSVGGGAALTLVGAAAAHADEAANSSTGTAAPTSGNATSTGNESASKQGQTLVVPKGSDPTVATLGAGTSNAGAGVSNSGANQVTNDDGESSQAVQTGNATSAGNQSHSDLEQGGTLSASGGGLTVLDQDARIRSWGGALADTGFSSGDGTVTGDADAWGNRSWTTILQQGIVDGTGGGLRILDQSARISNLGGAVANTGHDEGDGITTGNASAGGNRSTSGTTQSGNLTGDSIAQATVDQLSRTRNRGAAFANTGWNQTTGDDSTNDAKVFQNGVLVEQDPEP